MRIKPGPPNPKLERLIEEARKLQPMTPAQRFEQMVSFGDVILDKPN